MKNRFLLLVVVTIMIAGCFKIETITDSITNTSARELYQRDAKKHPQYNSWEIAYDAA